MTYVFMPQKRIFSIYDVVTHVVKPDFYAQLATIFKKHGFNALVDTDSCRKNYILLFFIIIHSANIEVDVLPILTRQVSHSPKFFLLTELSTGRHC